MNQITRLGVRPIRSISFATILISLWLCVTSGARAGDHWLSRVTVEAPNQLDTIIQATNKTTSKALTSILATSSTAVFDVTISLDSNPQGDDDYKADSGTDDDGQNAYEKRIEEFAKAVYQSTNGAHKIKKVTIFRSKPGAPRIDSADIFWDENCPVDKGPRATPSGFGVAGQHIWMCANWPGAASLMSTPKGGGYTLAHEWGHYTYGLYDEYAQEQCSAENIKTSNCAKSTPRGTDTAALPAIMNNQWVAAGAAMPAAYKGSAADFLEFSTQNIHPYRSDSKGTNAHKRVFGESTWQTLTRDPATDPKYSWLPKRTQYTSLLAPAGPSWLIADDESAALNELDIRWVGNQVTDLSIDVSGSMSGTPLTNAKKGANLLIDQIQTGSALGVSSFASSVSRVFSITDITDTGSVQTSAKAAVNALKASGSTSLYDGLMRSLTDINAFDQNRTGVVYVLSDGADNDSSATESSVINAYKAAGVPIIAFAYGSSAPTGTLLDMATQTGGALYQSPTTLADIQAALVSAETRFSSNLLLSSSRIVANANAEMTQTIPIDQSLSSARVILSYTGQPTDFDFRLIAPNGSDAGVIFTCEGAASCSATLDEAFFAGFGHGDYQISMTNKTGAQKNVTLLISAAPSGTETYDIAVGFSSSAVKYPDDMAIHATVSKGSAISGLDVVAVMTEPKGSSFNLQLLDNGKGADEVANDGSYSASVPYLANGIFSAVVTASNKAGSAQTTYEGVSFAQQVNGKVIMPTPTGITENFVRVGTATSSVTGIRADDHANTPSISSCTDILDDNTDTAGRIDASGDVDCFTFVPSVIDKPIIVRATSLTADMNPTVTIFDSTGKNQIAQANMSNSENPASGVITTIPTANIDAKGLILVVQHTDSTASTGGYVVSAGQSLSSDNVPILLLTPNGGEAWKIKTAQPINWYASKTLTKKGAKAKIQYSKNGGKTWKTLKKIPALTGKFQWKPKRTDVSNKARIRVCLPPVNKKAKPECDGSDAAFVITKE